MKRTIKLNESKLKKIIAETVNGILESEMPILHDEGNGEVYRDDAFVTDWRDNPNDEPNKVKAPYNSYFLNIIQHLKVFGIRKIPEHINIQRT